MDEDPRAVLRRTLGFDAFRPGQEALVRAVLAGRDAVGILPTGGGKSACYQVPAHMVRGLTLVVTPLVSLMEDQVGRARAAGLRAAHLSATQSSAERAKIRTDVCAATLDVLFVSPERLAQPQTRTWLGEVRIGLFVVDEAHCISEWGHDFRPAYRGLGRVSTETASPTLALTASATPDVRADIASNLRLRDPHIEIRSFDRPNLHWSVIGAHDERKALRGAANLVRRGGVALLYGPTRRRVASARDYLAALGIVADAYHAGLPGAERTAVQDRFMAGETRVVVATNAFGMGIDKADVRTVVHLSLPSSLEAYYQEAGRAGRDGEPARCLAYATPGDRRVLDRFVDETHPPMSALREAWSYLRKSADSRGVVEVARLVGGPIPVHTLEGWARGDPSGALGALERCGAVHRIRSDRKVAARGGTGAGRRCLVDARIGVRGRVDLSTARRLRKRARARLSSVDTYRRSRSCRRNAILRYFGEMTSHPCGRCDRCGWNFLTGLS